jgi:predicted nucleotidyltransferase
MAHNSTTMGSVQERIEEMVRRIVIQFKPEKIILFGSHARGEAGPDSDVDLLVVMAVEGSKRLKATEIDVALFGINVPVDLIVVRPEELERYRHQIGSIFYPALRDGKVLYDRAA